MTVMRRPVVFLVASTALLLILALPALATGLEPGRGAKHHNKSLRLVGRGHAAQCSACTSIPDLSATSPPAANAGKGYVIATPAFLKAAAAANQK